MPEYVTFVVPKELEDDVKRFLEQHPGAAAVPPSTPADDVDESLRVTVESREWTRDELEILRNGDAKSVKLFCQVLDLLAARSPAAVSLEEIERHTGVPTLRMQNSFGRVTVWIQNRMGGDKRWPIYWPKGSGEFWAMSDNNATQWRSIDR